MKWTVSTGDQNRRVEVDGLEDGDTAFDACVAALRTGHFNSLGYLMQAIPEGATEDDDERCFYCSSERVCEAAGMLQKD